MNPWLYLSVGILAFVLGFSGMSLAADDLKSSQSGEMDEGGVDGPPGSMVKIPEGEFVMGDNDGSRNERPEHTVWLDAYSIDRYEVTMADYQKILDHDYSIEPPPLWDDGAAMEKLETVRLLVLPGPLPSDIANG